MSVWVRAEPVVGCQAGIDVDPADADPIHPDSPDESSVGVDSLGGPRGAVRSRRVVPIVDTEGQSLPTAPLWTR